MAVNKMIISLFRMSRVIIRILLGTELWVTSKSEHDLSWFGHPSYGGWKIPTSRLVGNLAVLDAGVGEDLSFSEDCISHYGAHVLALDPTPRAETFVSMKCNSRLEFLKKGLSSENGSATFYLPTNTSNVSGSLTAESHLKGGEIEVSLTSLSGAIKLLPEFDTLIVKMDIEGAEFDLLDSDDFSKSANLINILCVEFHHRWPNFGVSRLRRAIDRLVELGFVCVWCNRETNEEFTFIRKP